MRSGIDNVATEDTNSRDSQQEKKVAEAGFVEQPNGHTHSHNHNGTAAPAIITPQETAVSGLDAGVAAIVVELTNGTKLRISISQ